MRRLLPPPLPLLGAAALLLLPLLLALANPTLEEELRGCSEDTLPEAELAWADRGGLETLGFVTPWNGKGYEVAEKFAHKFTYIRSVGASAFCEGPVVIG